MRTSLALLVASIALAAGPASAHFPWLTVDSDDKAIFFFGETPADRTYKLPAVVKDAKIEWIGEQNTAESVKFKAIETDELVGLQSVSSVAEAKLLLTQVTYGVYHGSRLEYYAQHLCGPLPVSRQAFEPLAKPLDLYAQITDTDAGIDVFVRWNGSPLKNAEVTLVAAEGQQPVKAATDADGHVSFTDAQVANSLHGIVVGHTVADQSGSINGQSYSSVSHYLTVTFNDSDESKLSKTGSTAKPRVTVKADVYPEIPQAVTSFGAAIADHSLYLYGGHAGRAHEYYQEAQGDTLWRLDLRNPKSWESVGTGMGLQGLAMVARDGKLYRIGGFTAKNKEGAEEDLWSQRSVSQFDPAIGKWLDLPPLPEPRSSFDAAVLGDRIYVIGGWSMQGGQDATWHDTAYVLDLAEEPLQWKPLPDPPFQRRALSVAAHDGKVYAIGGMPRTGGPTKRVDIFDTKSQKWSRGPDLNGETMDGFGSSSFATGGHLYATTYSGLLQRLSADGKSWVTIDRLPRDRFFHRLLPVSDNQLVAIGGASMSAGKFEQLDVIEIE